MVVSWEQDLHGGPVNSSAATSGLSATSGFGWKRVLGSDTENLLRIAVSLYPPPDAFMS